MTLLLSAFFGCTSAPSPPQIPPEASDLEAAPADVPDPDARFVHKRLDNGVRIAVLPNDHPPGVAFFELIVDAGFDHEDPGARGAAHFVEHMGFNGTRSFPGAALVPWLESHGVAFGHGQNAATTGRHTWYVVKGDVRDAQLADKLPAILRDWADGLAFDPEEIERERGVLVAEMEMRGAGSQERAGTPEDYRKISREALVAFHRTWYRADRMRLLVVGDVDADETVARLADAFSSLPAPAKPAPSVPPPDPARIQKLRTSGGILPTAVVWLDDVEDHAAEIVLGEVLAGRIGLLPNGRAGVDESGRASAFAAVDVESLLETMALGTPPSAAETRAARAAALLAWVERPFASTPTRTELWLAHAHRRWILDDRLPPDPVAEAAAERAAIASMDRERVAAAFREAADWDQTAIFSQTPGGQASSEPIPGPELQVLRGVFQTKTAPVASASPTPPPDPAPGPVERILDEGAVSGWRLPWGAEVLARVDDDLPVVLMVAQAPYAAGDFRRQASNHAAMYKAAEGLQARLRGDDPAVRIQQPDVAKSHLRVAGRFLPDRLDGVMGRLVGAVEGIGAEVPDFQPHRLRVVLTGPIDPAAVEAALVRVAGASIVAVTAGDAAPMPPLRALALVNPAVVQTTWRRSLRSLVEVEQLPYLASALREALRLNVRERMGSAYRYEVLVERAFFQTEIEVEITPGPDQAEAIAAELLSIRRGLVEAPLDEGTYRRVAMTARPFDPAEPDPQRWIGGMAERLVFVDSVADAAKAPATPPPDREALRALAELWLTEPIRLDD